MKKISKFLTATTLNYDRKKGNYVYFALSATSTVSIAVKIISDGEYHVFVLNSARAITTNLMNDIPKYVDGLKSVEDLSISDSKPSLEYTSKKIFNPYRIDKIDLDHLFASEPFIKKCVLKSELFTNKHDLYNLLVLQNNLKKSDFEFNFGKIDFSTTTTNNVFKIDSWDIHYDPNLKIDQKTITDLLHKSSAFLTKKNLGSLAHGQILIVKKLSGSTVADYSSATDLIRVNAIPKGMQLIETFLHEVVHRNFKKLNRDARIEIANKFREVNKPPYFSVGEKVKNKQTNECYIIKEVDYKRNGFSYVVDKCKSDNKLYRVTPELATANYIKDGDVPVDNSFIVRAYSLTNYEEFYCELFYKWLMDELKDPAKTWMDNLNKM